ncbi:MAG: excinuclease ABC subunit UvrA [Pseudomonadota bacterium]
MHTIRIRGARTHNLKNIDLDLPRDSLVVITGLSGSGKSSLAFDTIFAEGQRRYVESLSAYARQFLARMEKPDVDYIEGLSPAISIEQKASSHNPRSTVGTITEIYDYLRLLFARVGIPRCPEHGLELEAQTVSQMVDQLMGLPEGSRMMLLAPVVKHRKGEHLQLLEGLRTQGFIRARIDGEVLELDAVPCLDPHRKHSIDVVVDRFKIREGIELRLAESLEIALRLADGLAHVSSMDEPQDNLIIFSSKFSCKTCGYSLAELEPRLFSFNNPVGACPGCDGLGEKQYFDPKRIVPQPDLSLAGGAVRGWDRRNAYYFQLIQSLAKHYEFDIEAPFESLQEGIQHVILYGSGTQAIKFQHISDDAQIRIHSHVFEGIIPNIQRRHRETESVAVREELAKYLTIQHCPDCQGSRLNIQARNVYIADLNLPQISALPIEQAAQYFQQLELPGHRGQIAQRIIQEVEQRLSFLVNVGLDYLTLERNAGTLSGGETQRIRLASQIGAGLVGVMYILDEPSIGLHQRDNQRLLNTLTYLKELGNSVIIVEHDEEAIRSADHVVDMGPGAGSHGGQVVAQGSPEQIAANPSSLTGQYLAGIREIAIPHRRTTADQDKVLIVRGARGNNLKGIDVSFPAGLFICVTGVSGSGKSTLVNDTLYPYMARELNAANLNPAACAAVQGLQHFDKVIDIDQNPIGRTPRSNPSTYTGMFTPIRELFAGTSESRSRGYNPGRFSFNVKGGRCEACQGDGLIKVEMHFLPDVYVPCDICKGQRYKRETLSIQYKGKNIHEILEMTVEHAHTFFSPIPILKRKLQTLIDVGLSYITLGQSATTLSGGEAQRVKLSRELSKRDTGRTLYILDEPTTGLHFHDIEQLLKVLHRLRDHGNTVIVIEHNLDVIKTADWIIDMGPEGGDGGGQIVATGTPEEVARVESSYTGRYLNALLNTSRQRHHMA